MSTRQPCLQPQGTSEDAGVRVKVGHHGAAPGPVLKAVCGSSRRLGQVPRTRQFVESTDLVSGQVTALQQSACNRLDGVAVTPHQCGRTFVQFG